MPWVRFTYNATCCHHPRRQSLIFIVVLKVTQLCLTLCNLMDYSLPEASVHGILRARILEWVAIPFSGGSSWPRDWTQVSCIAGRFFFFFFFTAWATREAHYIYRVAMNTMTLSEPRGSHQFLHRLLLSSGIKASTLQTCWKALTSVSLFKLKSMYCYLACWLFSHLERVLMFSTLVHVWLALGLPQRCSGLFFCFFSYHERVSDENRKQ